MKSPCDANQGGLSLQLKVGEVVLLTVEDKEVQISVYETKRTSVRLNFKADQDVRINRLVRKRRVLNS